MRESSRRAAQRFLAYYEEVKRIHREDKGVALREYKPTEPDRLAETFDGVWGLDLRGAALLAELLHRLVWSQCLGNANHRTSILFVEGLLAAHGCPFPVYADDVDAEARFKAAVEQYSESSHKLLDRQSEFGYNPAQLERQHLASTRAWLQGQVGVQSRVETMMDPHRLMAFFS